MFAFCCLAGVFLAAVVRTVVIVSCHCLCLPSAALARPFTGLQPQPPFCRPLVFIFFLYFVRGARVTVTHRSGKRTRMSSLTPWLALVKGKNLLYLIIIFLLTIRDAYTRNNEKNTRARKDKDPCWHKKISSNRFSRLMLFCYFIIFDCFVFPPYIFPLIPRLFLLSGPSTLPLHSLPGPLRLIFFFADIALLLALALMSGTKIGFRTRASSGLLCCLVFFLV